MADLEDRDMRAVIAKIAADDADEVMARARAQARDRIQTMLADALTDAMLAHLGRRESAGDPEPTAPSTAAETPDPGAAADAHPEPGPAAGTGLYVYGVVSATDSDSLPAIDGIGGGPVSSVTAHELAAVISHVSLDDFSETRLREHLADMRWVEHIARGHEAVLESAGAAATLIPMRMCSIFRDEASVRAMLGRERAGLRDALSTLRGTTEWGLKGFALPPAEPAAEPESATQAPRTGAGYLQDKSRERRRRARAGEELAELCASIHASLAAKASRAVTLAPQRPEVSGHPGDMCLNCAYLVADADRDAFFAAVESCRTEAASQDVELVLTGPWPAYNFVPDAIGTAA